MDFGWRSKGKAFVGRSTSTCVCQPTNYPTKICCFSSLEDNNIYAKVDNLWGYHQLRFDKGSSNARLCCKSYVYYLRQLNYFIMTTNNITYKDSTCYIFSLEHVLTNRQVVCASQVVL